MRQRRVKNETEKVLSYIDYLIVEPEAYKNRWNEYFGNNNEIHIEIGCGKGRFITTLSEKNKALNYIAIEPIGSVILRALEKARAKELKNIGFLWKYADNIDEYIGENQVDKIYLNFSDPWPKERHAKRRLTHKNFLNRYKTILKPNGRIELKTDNKDLFEFSLEEFKSNGFTITNVSYDLHNTPKDNIFTEYEEKFSSKGMKIHYCEAVLNHPL